MIKTRPAVHIAHSLNGQSDSWLTKFVSQLRNRGVDTSYLEESQFLDDPTLDELRSDLNLSDAVVVVLFSEPDEINRKLFFEVGAASAAEKRLLVITPESSRVRKVPFLSEAEVILTESPSEAAEAVATALAA